MVYFLLSKQHDQFRSWLTWGFLVYSFLFSFSPTWESPPVSHSGGLVDALIYSQICFFLSIASLQISSLQSYVRYESGLPRTTVLAYPFTSSLLNRFFPPIYILQCSLQPYWVESRVEAISSNSSQLVITGFWKLQWRSGVSVTISGVGVEQTLPQRDFGK